MALLFHQNMKKFGGGAGPRVGAYNGAFQAMVAPGGPLAAAGPIMVGGFTEVTNNGMATDAFSGGGPAGINLCLDLGLVHVATVLCSITALANGDRGREYLAIGVNPACNIIATGRVLVRAWGMGLEVRDNPSPTPIPPPDWCNNLPKKATLDYRGLVYVIVDVPIGAGAFRRIAVGFIHNLYTFDEHKVLQIGQVPNFLAKMGQFAQVPGIAARYIGGDFNVDGRDHDYIGPAHVYRAGMGAAVPPAIVAPIPAYVPGGTLWSGNLYDYWFSDVWAGGGPPPLYGPPPPIVTPPLPLLPAPVASVVNTTLNAPSGGAGTMSDHCATALRII